MSDPKDEDQKPPTPRDGVSEQLIEELHKANQKLTRAREHIDQSLNADHDVLAEREKASNEVEEAERELEQSDDKIQKELKEKQSQKV